MTQHFGMGADEFDVSWSVAASWRGAESESAESGTVVSSGRPLGIAGDETSESVRTIFVFVGVEKSLSRGIRGAELLAELKELGRTWKTNEWLMREILGSLKGIVSSQAGDIPQDAQELPEFRFRVWYADSEPEGMPVAAGEKRDIEAAKGRYELLIVKDATATSVFVKGREVKAPPGRKAYKILSYILKHKGHGGTAWNIALHVYDESEPRLLDARKEAVSGVVEGDESLVNLFSRRIARRIADLNRYLSQLKTELKADDQVFEYSLTRTPRYCLIEEESQR